MLSIKKEEVEALPQFKNNIYWGPEKTLYKIIRIKERNSDLFYTYVNSLPNIPGLVLPIDLLKDGHIYGYQLPYIPDSQNIDELISSNKENIDVMAIMTSIFEALRNIHKYLILGDIRNTNILIKDDNALFIDWDFGKKLGSTKSLLVCYCIVINHHIIPDSKLSDILKTLLSALSVYYTYDFEELFANKDLVDLLEVLLTIEANPNLIYYVKYLIGKAKNNDASIDLQFTDIASFITPPSKKEKEKLARILPH